MHALIIEDDGLIAWLLEEELRELGYTSFDIADTEEGAVAAAERRPPDLVTSDGTLLEGTGVGAVRKILAAQDVPVVFVTADPEAAEEELPRAGVVEKPFDSAAFAAAVAGVTMHNEAGA